MVEPKEQKTVAGEYGDGYPTEKVPDPLRDEEETDHIVYDGEPVVGPQGE